MDERIQAQRFANQLLDEAYADPDDDYRVLARQFNRQFELIAMLVHAAGGRVEITQSHIISFDRNSTFEMRFDVASDSHILQLRALSPEPNPKRGSPPFPEVEAAGGGGNSPDVSNAPSALPQQPTGE